MAVQVRHNIAVAEYYRDGCTNPQKLLEVLSQVKVREYILGGILIVVRVQQEHFLLLIV